MWRKLLDECRVRVGVGMMRVGFVVANVGDKIEPPPASKPTPLQDSIVGDNQDEDGPVYRVEQTEESLRMLREGAERQVRPAIPPPKPPLAGSLAARMAAKR